MVEMAADIIVAVVAVVFAGMVVMNMAVVIAKLSHHQRIAEEILSVASNFVWLFRLGQAARRGDHGTCKQLALDPSSAAARIHHRGP